MVKDFQEQLRQARILVVDDEVPNVVLLETMLEGAGYSNVRSATDPRRMKALHREWNFHLILLDIRMPQERSVDQER